MKKPVLSMRLKQLERERLERAARYKGMTLSSLARSALLDAVREIERDMVMHHRAQTASAIPRQPTGLLAGVGHQEMRGESA